MPYPLGAIRSSPRSNPQYGLRSRANSNAKRMNSKFYFDWNIGKNVPIIGGSGLKFGTKSIVNKVRKSILEKKVVNSNTTTNSLTHNTPYTFGIFTKVPIGSGDSSRIGDAVHASRFRLGMFLQNSTVTMVNRDKSVKFRLLIVKHQKQVQDNLDTWAAGLALSDIFQNGTTLGISAIVDETICTVLYDSLISFPQAAIGVQTGGTGALTEVSNNYVVSQVDLKKEIPLQYISTTSNFSKGYNYYAVLIPHITGGTNGTTVCGDLVAQTALDFTDGL